MFHLMFVHYTFCSVWVAEWPPFGKSMPTRLSVCSYSIVLSIVSLVISHFDPRAGFSFWLHQFLFIALLLLLSICNRIPVSDYNWASSWENRSSGFPTRSDTNRAVQPQNMARDLKFRIKVVEGLYYPCSENKGADQLRGYREADLRLCFRICKNPVFSRRGSILISVHVMTWS